MKRILSLFLTGVYIGVTLGAPAMLLSSCGGASRETTEARDQAVAADKQAKVVVAAGVKHTVAQATANLDAVGGALITTGRAPEGQAVVLQVDVIDDALGIEATDKPMAKVSQAEWESVKGDLGKARNSLNALADEASQLKSALDVAKNAASASEAAAIAAQKKYDDESKSFANTKFGATVIGLGGVALWAARALNVPFVGMLSDPIIRAIAGPVLKPIESRAAATASTASTAATVVMASDIGRAALGKLDRALGSANPDVAAKLTDFIKRATGGSASTVEGLFKQVAGGVAMDAEKTVEVSNYLGAIRSTEIETHLGEPKILANLFKSVA
jgi:hypothetical protein